MSRLFAPGGVFFLVLSVATAAADWPVEGPVQVNVDSAGENIAGDAANEPTLAVDPNAPNRLVAAWRQFDDPSEPLRTAGWATSVDAGRSWVFHGAVVPGEFASDPVLEVDGEGKLYLVSLGEDYTSCRLHRSQDGGLSWWSESPALGGDKPWLAVDPELSHVYIVWDASYSCCGDTNFARSVDGGETFEAPIRIDPPLSVGSMTVGLDGELYIAGILDIGTFAVARSATARDPSAQLSFTVSEIDLGGMFAFLEEPNPEGLAGMPWVGVGPSGGSSPAPLYLLASVSPFTADPLDVHLVRSDDGGVTWSEPIRVNGAATSGWQWFGTLSVAPDGRLDAVWYDSPHPEDPGWTRVAYARSEDGGDTWSSPAVVAPGFDSHIGWPSERRRLGDYVHLRSDHLGADLVFAATYNGEQDIYFVRIGPRDCNGNGVADSDDIAGGDRDCDRDGIPDTCEVASGAEPDDNADGILDRCQPAPRRPSGRRGVVDARSARPHAP